MITLKKAATEDFEHIYPLLLQFNNPRLSKKDWRQLFINHWGHEENYFGFALVDEKNGKYVGFIGLIFSTREIAGKTHKFAGMTSWVIDNNYRRKGLGRMLLDEVLNLYSRGYTITDFTAATETVDMLKKNGFTLMDAGLVILRPRLEFKTITRLFATTYSYLSKGAKVKECLNGKDLTYFNHHSSLKSVHMVIKDKKSGETCYLAATKNYRGRYPHLKIHYLNNVEVFARAIAHINPKICLQFRVLGVILDKAYLKDKKIVNTVERGMPYMIAFKSDALEEKHICDKLYSEFFLLNL